MQSNSEIHITHSNKLVATQPFLNYFEMALKDQDDKFINKMRKDLGEDGLRMAIEYYLMTDADQRVLDGALQLCTKKSIICDFRNACDVNPHLIPLIFNRGWITAEEAREHTTKAVFYTITNYKFVDLKLTTDHHLDPAVLLALSRVARNRNVQLNLDVDQNGLEHSKIDILHIAAMSITGFAAMVFAISTLNPLLITIGVIAIIGLAIGLYLMLAKDVRTLIKAPQDEKRILSALKYKGLFGQKPAQALNSTEVLPDVAPVGMGTN